MTVVAVCGDGERAELLDALMFGDADGDADAIFVESISRGYTCIKQVAPDVVIVLLEMGDAAGCQLLSMLKNDRELSDIPVVTWTTRRFDGGLRMN